MNSSYYNPVSRQPSCHTHHVQARRSVAVMPHSVAASSVASLQHLAYWMFTGCRIGVRHDSYRLPGLKQGAFINITFTSSNRFADEPQHVSWWKMVKDEAHNLSPPNALAYSELPTAVKDWRTNGLAFYICMFCNMRPFALWKAMFCTAICGLLQRKTWHIAVPFAVLSAFRLLLCFVCFCVSAVSVFRLFPCFGVICNPPKYTIRICNPLKPSRLAVCKQGAVNRIANPYNKNRRIANHAGTNCKSAGTNRT